MNINSFHTKHRKGVWLQDTLQDTVNDGSGVITAETFLITTCTDPIGNWTGSRAEGSETSSPSL